MADENPTVNQLNSTAVTFSGGETTGGNECSALSSQLTSSIPADGNPNDHRRDSTAVNLSNSGTDGGDRSDIVGDIITTVSSNSPVAGPLYSLISSVMTSFDSRADATARSQNQLAFSLDRLTGELDKLLDDAPSSFIMQHTARISSLRQRVKALNTALKSIQRQIDNMDRMMSAGEVHETLVGESTGPQPNL